MKFIIILIFLNISYSLSSNIIKESNKKYIDESYLNLLNHNTDISLRVGNRILQTNFNDTKIWNKVSQFIRTFNSVKAISIILTDKYIIFQLKREFPSYNLNIEDDTITQIGLVYKPSNYIYCNRNNIIYPSRCMKFSNKTLHLVINSSITFEQIRFNPKLFEVQSIITSQGLTPIKISSKKFIEQLKHKYRTHNKLFYISNGNNISDINDTSPLCYLTEDVFIKNMSLKYNTLGRGIAKRTTPFYNISFYDKKLWLNLFPFYKSMIYCKELQSMYVFRSIINIDKYYYSMNKENITVYIKPNYDNCSNIQQFYYRSNDSSINNNFLQACVSKRPIIIFNVTKKISKINVPSMIGPFGTRYHLRLPSILVRSTRMATAENILMSDSITIIPITLNIIILVILAYLLI